MPRASLIPGMVAMGLKLLFSLVVFAVFCSAYPDHYRSRLWSIGGERGWNSNPRLRIYFYANFEEPPEIPMIWSQSLTDSSMGIAVLSLVVCLVEIVLHLYQATSFSLNIFYDMLMGVLWCYNVVMQSSADLTDPQHISTRPWYLEKSCDVVDGVDVGTCIAGKATFHLAVFSLILCLARLFLSCMRIAYSLGEQKLLDHLPGMVPTLSLYRLAIRRHPLLPYDSDRWDEAESTPLYMEEV